VDLGKLLVHYGVDMSEVERAQSQLSGVLESTHSRLSKLGAIAGAALGASLTTGLALATREFMTFDEAVTRAGVVAGASAEEMGRLREAARTMSLQTEYSATQVAQGMYFLASAGLSAAQQLSVLPSVLNLATAGNIEMADATDLLVRMLGAFRLEAKDAGHVADVMAKAVNSSQLEFQDLVYSMRYVAPIAAAAGRSIEEVTAALALMSLAGIKGEQAGTALRGALVRLVDPPKEAREAMQMMGVAVQELNPATHTLSEIIARVAERTKEMDDATRNQALSMLFGTEALSGMLSLINQGPDAFARMTKALEDSTGTAERAAEATRQTLTKQLQNLRNVVVDAAFTMLEKLMPAIRRVIDALKEWVTRGDLERWLSRFVDFAQAAWGAVTKLAGAVRGTVGLLGGLGPVLTGLVAYRLTPTILDWIQGFQHLRVQLSLAKLEGLSTFAALKSGAAGFSSSALLIAGGAAVAMAAIQGIIAALREQGSGLDKISAGLRSLPLLGLVADWTGYSAAVEGARTAEERLAQTHQQLMDILEGRKRTVQEIAAAHRAEAADISDSQRQIITLLRTGGVEAELARDIVVAGIYDQRAAWEALVGELVWARKRMDEEQGAAAEAYRLRAEYIQMAMAAWAAQTGYLQQRAAEAAQAFQALPVEIAIAMSSGNAEILKAGEAAIGVYVGVLTQKIPELQAKGAELARALSRAMQTQTPEAAASAAELLQSVLSKLTETKAMSEAEAAAIAQSFIDALNFQPAKDRAAQVLGDILSTAGQQGAAIAQEAEATGNAVEEGLTISEGPAAKVDHVLHEIDEALKWWRGPIEAKAAEIKSAIEGIGHGSGPLYEVIPPIYERMFARISSAMRRGLVEMSGLVERYRAPATVLAPATVRAAGAVGGPTPGAAPPVHLHLQVGTLIADDRSWEQLARKIELEVGPRVRRALGV